MAGKMKQSVDYEMSGVMFQRDAAFGRLASTSLVREGDVAEQDRRPYCAWSR